MTWDVISSGVGRELLIRLVSDSLGRGARSLRLLQGTGNLGALALYSKLGFEPRETLAFFAGSPATAIVEAVLARATREGRTAHQWGLSNGSGGNGADAQQQQEVQEQEEQDIAQCDRLWHECTGFSRPGALRIIAATPNRKAKRWLVKEGGKVTSGTRQTCATRL